MKDGRKPAGKNGSPPIRLKGMETEMSNILKAEEAPIPCLTPEQLKSLFHPEIRRKSGELKKKRKQWREAVAVGVAYVVFIVGAVLFLWNFVLSGFNCITIATLLAIGGISALLLCCLPLFIRFRSNIFERGEYRNEA